MRRNAADGELSRNPADELEELQLLGADFFPPAPTPTAIIDDNTLDASLRRLQIRRQHAYGHAWAPPPATEQVLPAAEPAVAAAAAAAASVHFQEQAGATPSTGSSSGEERAMRIPRENDAASLLNTLAIKDALLRQMEAALLLPLPEQAMLTAGLSRRAAALVANARRREALLAIKLRALTSEVEGFRKREKAAVAVNAGLRKRLNQTLNDLDAISLRREVRELRADLRAALGREAALQKELVTASARIEAGNAAALQQKATAERKMRHGLRARHFRACNERTSGECQTRVAWH